MKVVSNLLATEAQRSCNFFSATYPDRLVTKVYLTGGASPVRVPEGDAGGKDRG